MKKLLVAAAIVAGSCSLVMAQGTGGSGGGTGTGQGTSSAPSLQKQGTGGMNTERTAAPRVVKKKKKKTRSM